MVIGGSRLPFDLTWGPSLAHIWPLMKVAASYAIGDFCRGFLQSLLPLLVVPISEFCSCVRLRPAASAGLCVRSAASCFRVSPRHSDKTIQWRFLALRCRGVAKRTRPPQYLALTCRVWENACLLFLALKKAVC